MKILLTGSEGQLGSHFTESLYGSGAGGFELAGLSHGALDITDRDKILDVTSEVAPEVILNCAAYTNVDMAEAERDKAYAVNRDGARNLAEAAKRTGAALIHISTDFVFDGGKSSPYSEEDPTAPIGVYGMSKLAGEAEIAGILDEHIIVRTSWLYGSYGHNFVKTILRLAGEREGLDVVYDQTGTPTSAADLAGALARIVSTIKEFNEGKGGKHGKPPWGLYHYSNEGVASWYDFAVAVINEAGVEGVPLKCRTVTPVRTQANPERAKRPAYSVLGKEKIKEAFGLTIPHWRGSLIKILKALYGGNNA